MRLDELRFVFEGESFPLRNPQQGIYKPRILEAALSISTAFAPRPELRPYDDSPGPDGHLRYKWREDAGPDHYTTRSLRIALREGRPMIWFHGIAPGVYQAGISGVACGRGTLERQFVARSTPCKKERWSSAEVVDLDSPTTVRGIPDSSEAPPATIRARVLHAYESRCAICGSAIAQFWTPPTPDLIPKAASRSCRTASRCANSTTPLTTAIFWESIPTTACRFAVTCWTTPTDPRSATPSRRSTSRSSRCHDSGKLNRTKICLPSASRCSAEPLDGPPCGLRGAGTLVVSMSPPSRRGAHYERWLADYARRSIRPPVPAATAVLLRQSAGGVETLPLAPAARICR